MTDVPDAELLEQFARNNSETAFATIVQRHISLVHSVALRHTTDRQHAQDITQAVFIILARKAGSLRNKTVLAGWLYHAARLTAANFRRAEESRVRREQEAFMQSTLEETASDTLWRELSPLLDEAMARLGTSDRDALVLRYFQNKSLNEVSAALGVEERAVQKRVARAVAKLRKFFLKRGLTFSAVAIAGAVAANSVQAAPVGLVATVTVAAAKGATISATLTTLVKATMKTMTWTKLKFTISVGTAVLLAGSVATMAISQTRGEDNLTPQEIARQSQETYAALSSYCDTGNVISEGGGQTLKTIINIRLQRPNFYRVDWTSTGGLYNGAGVVWSDGTGDFIVSGMVGQEKNANPVKMHNMQFAMGSAGGASVSQLATVPAIFFKQNWGDQLQIIAKGRSHLKKEGDEKIDNMDCFVITSVLDPIKLPNNMGTSGINTTRLWIGKQDHLIHQTQTISQGASIPAPHESDSDITAILEKQNKPVTPDAIASLRTELETQYQKYLSTNNKSGKYVFTETHENISLNEKSNPSDFVR